MPALSGGMILYSSRSAKSVACSRLNVIGVSAFFFLPVLVAAFTSADEFHSVTKTRCPDALSHLASSANCVVLPEPSIPSTTNSLPGYSCGCVRLFSICVAADLDAERLSRQAFEWSGVARGRPELQLRVARRPQLEKIVVAAIVELEAGDGLRVAAIEALRQPQDRRQRAHRPPRAPAQIAEAVVLPLGRRLTVIARDERDGFDLVRLEAAQVAVLHEIVRVLVVAFVADVDADVVQDRGVLEPLALVIGEAVDGARLVEEPDREPRHVLRVLRPVVAALGELEDAAAADVGIAIGLRDFLAVPRDVVEHQPFAQGEIAQRDLGRAEPAEQLVDEDRPGDHQIGAARLEPRDAQTLFEIQRDELLADAVDLLRGETAVAQRCAGREPLGRRRDRAEAEDRAGGADDALEPRARDLIQVLAGLGVDVPHELALIARLERIGFHEPFGEADDAELEAAAELDRGAGAARDLDAAAADIDHDGDVARHADAVHRGHVDEPGFFRARDHAWTNAGLLRDRLQEFAAVLGLPRRAGGDGDNLINLMGFGQTPEFRENLKRRVHRLGRQRPAVEAAGAQADHFLLAIDDLEGEVRAHLHHNHVDGVGPDIDGRNAHKSVPTIMEGCGRPAPPDHARFHDPLGIAHKTRGSIHPRAPCDGARRRPRPPSGARGVETPA